MMGLLRFFGIFLLVIWVSGADVFGDGRETYLQAYPSYEHLFQVASSSSWMDEAWLAQRVQKAREQYHHDPILQLSEYGEPSVAEKLRRAHEISDWQDYLLESVQKKVKGSSQSLQSLIKPAIEEVKKAFSATKLKDAIQSEHLVDQLAIRAGMIEWLQAEFNRLREVQAVWQSKAEAKELDAYWENLQRAIDSRLKEVSEELLATEKLLKSYEHARSDSPYRTQSDPPKELVHKYNQQLAKFRTLYEAAAFLPHRRGVFDSLLLNTVKHMPVVAVVSGFGAYYFAGSDWATSMCFGTACGIMAAFFGKSLSVGKKPAGVSARELKLRRKALELGEQLDSARVLRALTAQLLQSAACALPKKQAEEMAKANTTQVRVAVPTRVDTRVNTRVANEPAQVLEEIIAETQEASARAQLR